MAQSALQWETTREIPHIVMPRPSGIDDVETKRKMKQLDRLAEKSLLTSVSGTTTRRLLLARALSFNKRRDAFVTQVTWLLF